MWNRTCCKAFTILPTNINVLNAFRLAQGIVSKTLGGGQIVRNRRFSCDFQFCSGSSGKALDDLEYTAPKPFLDQYQSVKNRSLDQFHEVDELMTFRARLIYLYTYFLKMLSFHARIPIVVFNAQMQLHFFFLFFHNFSFVSILIRQLKVIIFLFMEVE